MFLTNNSLHLCVLFTSCIKFRQNSIASNFQEYQRIRMKIIHDNNFQALASISENFPEILNFRKIYNPNVRCQ